MKEQFTSIYLAHNAGIIIWFNQVKYKEKKWTNTPMVLTLANIPWKNRSCHVRIIKNQAHGIKKKKVNS